VAPQWKSLTDLAANAAADAVFRGVVIDVSKPEAPQYSSSRVARLKVLQTVKGNVGTDVDVEYQQANGANCGRIFTTGNNVWMRTKKLGLGRWQIIGAEGDAAPTVYLGTSRIVDEHADPRIGYNPQTTAFGDLQSIIRKSSIVNGFEIPSVDPAGPKINPACLSRTADPYRWWRVGVDRRGRVTRVRSFFSMNPATEKTVTSRAREILEAPRFLPGRINNIPAEMEIVVADLDVSCSRSK